MIVQTLPLIDVPYTITSTVRDGVSIESTALAAAVEALGAPVNPRMIEFFIPQAPQGKQSPRAVEINGFARVIKDPKTRKYESGIAAIAHNAMQGREPLTVPVSMSLAVWMQVPASWSEKKRRDALEGRIYPMVKPDCSNVLKAIEDGCNGVVFADDKQVARVEMSKRYGATPGVAVMVRPI